MTDVSIVRPANKDIVLARTDTGRLFKVLNTGVKTDGHIDENNRLIRGSKTPTICKQLWKTNASVNLSIRLHCPTMTRRKQLGGARRL
jgi:hypothetical protein